MAAKPLDALVEVLLQVSALTDADRRDALVSETATALRRRYTTRRSADARTDLSSLINSYATLSGGLITFAGIVAERHPGPEADRARERVRTIEGSLLLSEPD